MTWRSQFSPSLGGVRHHLVAVPRLDGGDHRRADRSFGNVARVCLTSLAPRLPFGFAWFPSPIAVAVQPFVVAMPVASRLRSSHDDVMGAARGPIREAARRPEVVDDMQLLVDSTSASSSPSSPGPSRAPCSAMTRTGRPSVQLPFAVASRPISGTMMISRLAVAVDVHDADAVNRRLVAGHSCIVHSSSTTLAALQPLQLRRVGRVERLPRRAEDEFGQAVAVDVDGRGTDVVRLRLAVEDDPLLPASGSRTRRPGADRPPRCRASCRR